MKRMILVSILAWVVVGFNGRIAAADAELRLYEGSNEWDLKDRILVHSDGTTFDFLYKKVCTAYTGCAAVPITSDQDAQLAHLATTDIKDLNAAIGKLSEAANSVNVNPAKPALCRQFSHFVYEVKNSAGKAIKSEEINACTGTRLSDSNAVVVERILNIAAGFAGF